MLKLHVLKPGLKIATSTVTFMTEFLNLQLKINTTCVLSGRVANLWVPGMYMYNQKIWGKIVAYLF